MATLKRHIWLCGFMGCGKSTVGSSLAKLCDAPFLDMDSYIEEVEGRRIPEIFADSGEPYFRKLETETVISLKEHTPAIIATGGGVMVSPLNAQEAKKSGAVVLLDIPFEACYNRIYQSDRPIVRRSSKEELQALYNTRRALYLSHADIVLDAPTSSDKAVQDLIQIIAKFE